MSLAFGPNKGKTRYLYAGVNSSPAEVAKGSNQHLRTLAIEPSKARSSVGAKLPEVRLAEVSRTSMFANPDSDTYQRLLRVAGSMAAAATAMGKESQLAVFEPSGPNPKLRGLLELPRDAVDLDLVCTGENEYQVAYCFKHELFAAPIGKENKDPECIYTIPEENGVRPSFRFIRYLSPKFILAVANLPQMSGVVLLGLRLPAKGQVKTRIAVSASISRKISATALAVANLSPASSPVASTGDAEFVIAVAGNDSSISLYTLQHRAESPLDLLVNLLPVHTLKDVHGSDNITGLAFSNFATPKTHVRPQFIKLAGISLQKTVVVHRIPLKKYVDKADRSRKGPPRPVRYVVAQEAKEPSNRPIVISLSIMVLLAAICGQAIMEFCGQSRPILHLHKVLPTWQGSTQIFGSPPLSTPEPHANELVAKLMGDRWPNVGERLVMVEMEDEVEQPEEGTATTGPGKMKQRKITVDVHDAQVHGSSKLWEELDQEQRQEWKEKLKDAGAWSAEMGESVFKGIMFAQLAQAVGRAAGG